MITDTLWLEMKSGVDELPISTCEAFMDRVGRNLDDINNPSRLDVEQARKAAYEEYLHDGLKNNGKHKQEGRF
jgi:hypothetical protein